MNIIKLRTFLILSALVFFNLASADADYEPVPIDAYNTSWILPERFFSEGDTPGLYKHDGVLDWFIYFQEFKPVKNNRSVLVKEMYDHCNAEKYKPVNPPTKVFNINGLAITRYRYCALQGAEYGNWVNGTWVHSTSRQEQKVIDYFYLSTPKGEVKFCIQDWNYFSPERFDKMEMQVLGSIKVK